MNPLQAIKCFCSQCWLTRNEECDPILTNNPEKPFKCPLFKYKKFKAMRKYKRRILKAIRKHCFFCCNNNSKEVVLCVDKECTLYLYRNEVKRPLNTQTEGIAIILKKVS